MNRSSSTEQSPQGFQPRFRVYPVCAAFLLLLHLAIPTAVAQQARPNESELEAADLVNFGKFVREPGAQPFRTSFDICLLGHDAMGHTLDQRAANQAIGNLPVHVRRLLDITAAKDCAVIFMSADEGAKIREDLAILSPSDALTVSDASDFLERGGMIQFLLVENHLRFAVNLVAVKRAHLTLSSELLRVAFSVTGKPLKGDVP